ncbi:MAG: phage tail protein [Xanthomonadaceae bacterium]|jgi:microcystin-dependent protein|nr:phage tail protein [Xanthomonadaceae bacterium]MDE3073009.1 phage tail protein [Pseudomonadota bacterium]
MTTPFLGEIQLFGFNFPPQGWAACNGATLPISQYTALFSLLGTTYGGNGQTTFQLPNFSTRAPCSQGTGPGLTPREAGETFGDGSVTLNQASMPTHAHALNVFNQPDTGKHSPTPATGYGIVPPQNSKPFIAGTPPSATFAPNTLGPAGSGVPHENRQPFLALNFCIALNGAFPSFD